MKSNIQKSVGKFTTYRHNFSDSRFIPNSSKISKFGQPSSIDDLEKSPYAPPFSSTHRKYIPMMQM